MKIAIKSLIDYVLDLSLKKREQHRLGSYIFHRVRGEGNENPETNGEYRLLRIIKERIRGRRALIFDAGANIGNWTMEAIIGMPPGLTVHAFEPSKFTYAKLQENLSHSKHESTIKLVNAALSDVDGQSDLYIAGELHGTNSLHVRHAEVSIGLRQETVEKVVLRRGDSYCAENGIDHIDFMKVDTEGHEMTLFLGFAEMLTKERIDCIQFEYGPCWIDSRNFLFDAFKFFSPKGYLIGKIYPHQIGFFDLYDQGQENFAYANYVAVRKTLRQYFE